MLVVGLTGGIATGKSTVSALLKAKQLAVVDADVIAREVVQPGTAGLTKIKKAFGPTVILPDGSLDRKALGAIIFNDPDKRKTLNSIVHPAVRRALLWGVVKAWMQGHAICILDVPLLIEGPLWKLVGKVVVVYCTPEKQLQRLMSRDGSSEQDALSRLNSQLPIDSKKEYADVLIDNSGPREVLEKNVDDFVLELERGTGWCWWRICWLVPPIGLLSAVWTLARRNMRHSFGHGRIDGKRD